MAADGVVEINHLTALAGGVSGDLALDPPGYPVTITSSGSYRVTSHMPVPDANTDGIVVTALRTSIDLGGFEIRGPNRKPTRAADCTAPGTGIGVRSLLSVRVWNGRVSGMGSSGLALGSSSRIENVQATENCGNGLAPGPDSSVLGAVALRNDANGIEVGLASRVQDSVSDSNRFDAIRTGPNSIVTGCVGTNSLVGIRVGLGSSVSESVASGNQVGVIALDGGSTVVHVSASGNSLGVGIDSTAADGIGGNTLSQNFFPDIPAGVLIHCNAVDGAASCP